MRSTFSTTLLKRGVNEIRKENRSGDKSPERVLKTAIAASLTNAGAQETPVVVQTHLAAGEKIRHRCYRLPVAIRAGTHRQDEVTQGKSCASL
ncbi:MAG: hypothetical protein DME61_02435 [Verrucomicrobia bacterium]|nr:MAG: hypothetical protein DME61_02435 [Verrucomicrobiota bacterium]